MYRIFFLFLLSVLFFSCSNKEPEQKPNIIIILADDQGWGDLGVTGNSNLSTPNIDNLAEKGVMFDRFYVCPVCSPTRAELLTGRYHVRGGVYSTSTGGERLDLDETTIAEVFKKAGYATAAYGKWHNGMQPPYHPNYRGFDDYYGFCSGHWGNYFSPMLEHNGKIVKGEGFVIDDFTNHGLRFMEKNKDNSFFLYLPFNTPHAPMQVPEQFWEKYRNKELTMLHRDTAKEDIHFTRTALAMCENIDWNVGRITQKIGELGIAENTIVIYLSDNGPNSWRWNGGMRGRKGSTDEGGVRSPMIMKWEGTFEAGKKIKEIASGIDLLPTLADLTGIELNTEKPLDGISIKPLLLENNPQWNDRFIFNYWRGRTSVRNQKFRLDDQDRLYDMESDRGQDEDVSEQYPEIYTSLVNTKKKWITEVASELDTKADRPFTVGYKDALYTQLPARDGVEHGNIKRSNRYPNCTYFMNWISTKDSITWEVEVLETGNFEVELYYTCPVKDIGSLVELSLGDSKLEYKLNEAHDPPLIGMDEDLFPRWEGYVKDFHHVPMGIINLQKGKGTLTLKALDIPGSQVMDVRLLLFKKV